MAQAQDRTRDGWRDAAGRLVNPLDVPLSTGEARDRRTQQERVSNRGDLVDTSRNSGRDPFSRLREFRSMDGSGNNVRNPDWGRAAMPMVRLCEPAYEDGAGTPSGYDRPSPRHISNIVAAQDAPVFSARRTSDYIWQWGQFLDHDLDLTPTIDPAEQMDVAVPFGDAHFDPFSTGTATIPLNRSFYEIIEGVRHQINILTSFIDASNVYGSDDTRAMALRTLDGTGRLKTSTGQLLPLSLNGDPNVPDTTPPAFVAGDVRANEQVALTAIHTLFVREHNRWADIVRRANRRLDDEGIYQRARAIVAAEMQVITYNEFLPILLGRNALGPYRGYNPRINPAISNEFATAAYRVGHTMLSPQIQRLDGRLRPVGGGPLALRDAFFNPAIVMDGGIDPILRGLAWQTAQEIDHLIVDDVRNFLFGPPGAGGFDLPALNMQRGRDHGLPDYNQVRIEIGLSPVSDFAGISSDPEVQARLAEAYGSVDKIDLWMAGISEDHVPGAIVGETFWTILSEQFRALRDGDRFWYQRYLPSELRRMVEDRILADIIRDNTTVRNEISDNVFIVRSNLPRR